MHFYCSCGNRISDITDFLSFKASFLADQDEDDYFGQVEQAVQDGLPDGSLLDVLAIQLPSRYLCRSMYQCPQCGNLFLEDTSGKLHEFVPKTSEAQGLLRSVEQEKWRGFLHGYWNDTPPSWSEHCGFIEINSNDTSLPGYLTFDERKNFEERYFELFETLKQRGLIRFAGLKINRDWLHRWSQGKGEQGNATP